MPTYEIAYHDVGEVSHIYGRTRSAAKYQHYLSLDSCFETFKEYLGAVKSVRKVADRKGVYDFIERQYGVSFEVGDKVLISGEGSATGKIGEVVHPMSSGAYVNVLLDGVDWLFHPMSLSQPKHIEE